MKINLWGINYAPEQTGIGVYNTLICNYLRDAGYDISVTTGFPYYPSWTSTDRGFMRDDVLDGIPVHRNWLYVPSKPSTSRRILHELSFVLTSSFRQLLLPAADVYLVASPPLFLGFAAWLICALKRRPFIFHVYDLQPDAAVALGMLKESILVKLAFALERLAYEKAAMVTVVSQDMREALIRKGVPAEKVMVVANVVDVPKDEELPAPLQWKSRFNFTDSHRIISYSGNLGVKQGIDLVLEAAELLAHESSIKFVICGDGADRERIRSILTSRKLCNVTLMGLQSRPDYLGLLMDSDFCLLTQKPGTGASFLPSKLLNILALGRPIISNADPDSALYAAMKKGQFGLHCESNGASLAKAIIEGLSNSERAKQMSQCGRAYVSQLAPAAVYRQLSSTLVAICKGSV